MTEQIEVIETDEDSTLTARIIHVLQIYPGISITMLQAGLGPQTRPADWRPVMEGLIAQGVILKTSTTATTPKGRRNDYTKLQLSETFART